MAQKSCPRSITLSTFLILMSVLVVAVLSQDCSKSNPCATGCCSKDGWCGTTEAHCGAGCVDTCDFKLGCDRSNPCPSGCCSIFGFCGLGPDFCDPEVCVVGCESKAYCDPGFGPQWAEKAKCPLNVCCSKFGFCGLTEEFCGDKKVEKPSCSKDGTLDRVIGYYEGWGSRRPCNDFWPEQIPRGVYTIINFAFAIIDPVSFEVRPAATEDIELYSRLTGLKADDPSLRIFIAIGGWTFNNPGPTATTFSDIARSEANQKAFFKSLISFMAQYDFDGVDLDWEYPAADDRSGRPEDFDNFPKFMANLKAELKRTGGRDGLSITLPASYWYLQHFDIVELEKSVDFFNIMSYDLHGAWDKGNKWTGEYLNPHTNLTEIDMALDLLWRNNIDSKKVVLGLAFYARAYTVVSTSCVEPGCLFASGSNKGDCSHEIGILLNSEIDKIVNSRGLSPTLYEKEAVKIVSWDDQWLSYDDGDTLKLKAEYARSRCLGGVMVWAISHDTKEAKYSRALAKVTNRRVLSLPMLDGTTEKFKIPHDQCKWTNCNENCPSDWQLMPRTDDGAGEGEWMLDNSGCDGIGIHRLCCPSKEMLPTCGWYTLPRRGGNCNSQCPDGMKEVGSNSNYCDNDYQAACCTTDESNGSLLKAMTLYETCDWALSPMCMDGVCQFGGSPWPTTLVESPTGSGGAICNMRPFNLQEIREFQKRKYCCDTSTASRTWSNCAWYDSTGFGSSAARCYSGCPSDKTRVAMDGWGGGCKGFGSRAYCCDADYYEEGQRLNAELQKYKDAMTAWTANTECPWGINILTRRSSSNEGDNDLVLRADQNPINNQTPAELVLALLTTLLKALFQVTHSETWVAQEGIYSDGMREKYPNLVGDKLFPFLEDYPSFRINGAEKTSELILCEPNVFDTMVARKSTLIMCEESLCGEDSLCEDDFDEDSPYASNLRGGKLFTRAEMGPGVSAHLNIFEKRADLEISFTCIDAKYPTGKDIKYKKSPWTSAGGYDPADLIYDNALSWQLQEHCSDTNLRTTVLPDSTYYCTEHILEVQTMKKFFTDAASTDSKCEIDCDFFLEAFNLPIISANALPGGFNSELPSERIMEALGSKYNKDNFVLLRVALNGMKSRVWRLADPSQRSVWSRYVRSSDPRKALSILRDVIMVFNYLNHSPVRSKLVAINKLLREQFQLAQDAYKQQTGRNIDLVDCWDQWFENHRQEMVQSAVVWVRNGIREMRVAWDQALNLDDDDYQARARQVNEHLNRLEYLAFRKGEIQFELPQPER